MPGAARNSRDTSKIVGKPSQVAKEIEDGGGELVVPVARDHVAGARNVGEAGMRHQGEELPGVLLLDQLRGSPAYQHGRNRQGPGRRDQALLDLRAVAVDRPAAIEKARVP